MIDSRIEQHLQILRFKQLWPILVGKLQATSTYILQPLTLVELKKAVEYESNGPLPLSKWRVSSYGHYHSTVIAFRFESSPIV